MTILRTYTLTRRQLFRAGQLILDGVGPSVLAKELRISFAQAQRLMASYYRHDGQHHGPIGRCPICTHQVVLPCAACHLRARLERVRTARRAAPRRGGGER